METEIRDYEKELSDARKQIDELELKLERLHSASFFFDRVEKCYVDLLHFKNAQIQSLRWDLEEQGRSHDREDLAKSHDRK